MRPSRSNRHPLKYLDEYRDSTLPKASPAASPPWPDEAAGC